MTQPLYARWAGRFLGANAEEPAPVDEREREAAIGAIERAIREKRRQKARTRWAIRLSAAAAAILCIGLGANAYRTHGSASGSSASASVSASTPATVVASEAAPLSIVGTASGLGATISTGPGATFALTDGAHIAPGHRIVARGRSRASLAFSTGTQLTVENGGDLAVVEEGRSQIFSLSAGEIRARVAKLGAGERFVVRTPDAEVEVRGTSFSVAIARPEASCGGGTVTRVTVDEGVVVVRAIRGATEARVSRGEEWPAGCDSSLGAANGDTGDTGESANTANTGNTADIGDIQNTNTPSGRRPTRREGVAGAGTSSLGEQNDLFGAALSYKNSGQHAAAIAAFERFLARYPSSNLAENAAVERMKLLLADDHPRGVSAAKQYLRRYPNGFAQSEARAAVTGSP